MDKEELVLAGLAADGENASFTPVQVQKLFFLIDREATHLFDGPHFNFKPYDYGPFDKSVYEILDVLSAKGLCTTEVSGRYRKYRLTQDGFQVGTAALESLNQTRADYLKSLASWVRNLSFEQLVSAIYTRHPDMRVNSVFKG